MKDYNELVRRSIRKDFAKANFKRNGRVPKEPHPKHTRRVLALNEQSEYFKYRKFFVGKLIRVLDGASAGGVWVEFVRDADRESLNAAAGWSSYKRKYLLYGVKFDD